MDAIYAFMRYTDDLVDERNCPAIRRIVRRTGR